MAFFFKHCKIFCKREERKKQIESSKALWRIFFIAGLALLFFGVLLTGPGPDSSEPSQQGNNQFGFRFGMLCWGETFIRSLHAHVFDADLSALDLRGKHLWLSVTKPINLVFVTHNQMTCVWVWVYKAGRRSSSFGLQATSRTNQTGTCFFPPLLPLKGLSQLKLVYRGKNRLTLLARKKAFNFIV